MKFFNAWWRDVVAVLSDLNNPWHIRMLADWYWKGVVIIAFIVVLSVFACSLFWLMRIQSGLGASLDTSAPPPPALNRPELDFVVGAFDARKTAFDALKSNRPVDVKDPSI